jgi:CRP/FNR family transcriptional regulator, cyclic AMP receptor protein
MGLRARPPTRRAGRMQPNANGGAAGMRAHQTFGTAPGRSNRQATERTARAGQVLNRAYDLLGKCTLFSGLSAEERAALSARARVQTYNAGEIIFSMSSAGNQMMALLSGTIRISLPLAQGKELFLAIIQPGEIFGELAVLDGHERSAEAVADSNCSVAMWERNDILSLFERNPSMWPSLVRVLVERLRRTDQNFADVALLELPIRLAKILLRILRGKTSSAGIKDVRIRFSQRDLANMVGSSRESVNKCLRNWQRKGVLRLSEGSITITNCRALEHIADLA